MPKDRAVMKIEELTQDKLDEILESNQALVDAQKSLKSDLTKLRAKAKGADIDPEEHAALQSQVAELTDKLGKTEKTYKTEFEKINGQLNEKSVALDKFVLDGSLTNELLKANVKKEFMDASKALLKGSAKLEFKDGSPVVMIDGKPLTEAIKSWTESDQGKHFVSAPVNNGGGGEGGQGGGGVAKTMSRDEFVKLPQIDKVKFSNAGGTLTD